MDSVEGLVEVVEQAVGRGDDAVADLDLDGAVVPGGLDDLRIDHPARASSYHHGGRAQNAQAFVASFGYERA